MNLLEILKEIIVFALRLIYRVFTILDFSFLGWEIFPGLKIYYVFSVIAAYYIGKDLIVKIIMIPVKVFSLVLDLLLSLLKNILQTVFPFGWKILMSIFRFPNKLNWRDWSENLRDRIEDWKLRRY